jgi:hypothetical protein
LEVKHKERSGFTNPTKPKVQKVYDKEAANIQSTAAGLHKVVVNYQSLRKYEKEAYWGDLVGWLGLLTNVLARATYFPYSHLLKNMTPILSKSPLHLLFQKILDRVGDVKVAGQLANAVDQAVGIGLIPWREHRAGQFNKMGDHVFARSVSEDPKFFGDTDEEVAGEAFVLLGGLTIDAYLAELLKGSKGRDLVTQAILHIKPVKDVQEERSSVIPPDERTINKPSVKINEIVKEGSSEESKSIVNDGESKHEEPTVAPEKVTLAVLELRNILGKGFWPIDKWVEYATPYGIAAEVLSHNK